MTFSWNNIYTVKLSKKHVVGVSREGCKTYGKVIKLTSKGNLKNIYKVIAGFVVPKSNEFGRKVKDAIFKQRPCTFPLILYAYS